MGGGAGVSAKTCKCCGGNGWEGSNCEATRRENDRLWREYEEGLDRINNQRREILSQAKELEKLEAYRTALKRIRDCDFVITLPDRMDAVRAIAREALE
jgi:hypothetical protein